MPGSIPIGDVPDDILEESSARAARAGQSLQDFVRARLIELARRPSAALWDRVERGVHATRTDLPGEEIVRLSGRDRR